MYFLMRVPRFPLWSGLKYLIHTQLVKLSQAEWFLEDTLEAVLLNEQENVRYTPRMEQTLAPYVSLDMNLNIVSMEHGTRKENMSDAKGWPNDPWTVIIVEGDQGRFYYAFNTQTGERKHQCLSYKEALESIKRYAEPWGV